MYMTGRKSLSQIFQEICFEKCPKTYRKIPMVEYFSNKAVLLKRNSSTGVSCEFSKITQNRFLVKHLQTTSSEPEK